MKKIFPFLLLLLAATRLPAQEMYTVFQDSTLTFYYDDQKDTRPGTVYEVGTDIATWPRWQDVKEDIIKAVFDRSFAEARPPVTDFWFEGCSNLKEIDGIEFLNTSNTISMYQMFAYCSGLTSLDVSHFDTDKVTSMRYMFSGCSSLTSLDVSHFDTANVTDMGWMFSDCLGLSILDLSHFDTGNVTDMGSMFQGCSGLTSLDVSHFNTGSVTSMVCMFSSCSGLTSLDVSHFNTGNVTDMWSMFFGCSGLTSLDVSHFDTGNVTHMVWMFGKCSGLTSLDVSHFNTGNVTSMNCMFFGCSGLTSLGVSGFDTGNVTDMNFMFSGCPGLTSLDLSHFDTGNVTGMKSMFGGCSSLTSLDLSYFDTGNVTDMSSMFSSCSSLADVCLGGNFTPYADWGMRSCRNLATVRYLSESPADISSECFATETYAMAKLIVPVGTKDRYEAAKGWKEFKHITEDGVTAEEGGGSNYGDGEIDEDTDLDGNVVGNIYYSISDKDGEYSSTEGCIILRRPTTDEDMEAVEGKDLFGEELKDHFSGIIFMVQPGSGLIKVNAESAGGMTLKVKVGDGAPMEMVLGGQMTATFPYTVDEPTFVYVYAGVNAEFTRRLSRTGTPEQSLKIYGIEWAEADITSVSPVCGNSNGSADTIYDTAGRRKAAAGRGIYVVNGRKVLIK